MEETIRLSDVANQLNVISWDILILLSQSKNVSYTELRKALSVSQDKCSREIARLEGALLIKSESDPHDNRALLFNLSENGLNILKYKK